MSPTAGELSGETGRGTWDSVCLDTEAEVKISCSPTHLEKPYGRWGVAKGRGATGLPSPGGGEYGAEVVPGKVDPAVLEEP